MCMHWGPCCTSYWQANRALQGRHSLEPCDGARTESRAARTRGCAQSLGRGRSGGEPGHGQRTRAALRDGWRIGHGIDGGCPGYGPAGNAARCPGSRPPGESAAHATESRPALAAPSAAPICLRPTPFIPTEGLASMDREPGSDGHVACNHCYLERQLEPQSQNVDHANGGSDRTTKRYACRGSATIPETSTSTPTDTSTARPAATDTSTATLTQKPTATRQDTPTPTPKPTATQMPSATPTPRPTKQTMSVEWLSVPNGSFAMGSTEGEIQQALAERNVTMILRQIGGGN